MKLIDNRNSNFRYRNPITYTELTRAIVDDLTAKKREIEDGLIERGELDHGNMPTIYIMTPTFVAYGKHQQRVPTDRTFDTDDKKSNYVVKPKEAFERFEKFYTYLLSKLMNNFDRPSKRHLQPITYAFIDTPSSKHKKKGKSDPFKRSPQTARANIIGKAHPDDSVHIHALMLVRPEIKQRFDKLIETKGIVDLFQHLNLVNKHHRNNAEDRYQLTNYDGQLERRDHRQRWRFPSAANVRGPNMSVDVQPVDHLDKAVRYCSSYLTSCPPENALEELFIMLPKSSEESDRPRTAHKKRSHETVAEQSANTVI